MLVVFFGSFRFITAFSFFLGLSPSLLTFSGAHESGSICSIFRILMLEERTQRCVFSYITIDHLWSLAVEEQFYCVWPAIVFFIKDRIQLMKMAGLLMAGSTLVRLLMLYGHKSLWMIYVFTPARAEFSDDRLGFGFVVSL